MFKWTVLFLVVIGSWTAWASETIYLCDKTNYSRDVSSTRQQYEDLKENLIISLTQLGCYPQATNSCDQMQMARLVSEFEKSVNDIGLSFQSRSQSAGCYQSLLETNIFTASALSNSQISKVIKESNDWTSIGVEYNANCMQEHYSISTCHQRGQKLLECRPGMEINVWGRNATQTDIKCGGTSDVPAACSQFYSELNGVVCGYSETQWDSMKACIAAPKVKEREERCPIGCAREKIPQYHICDWTKDEYTKFAGCTAEVTLEASLIRSRICPNGNKDVDELGPPPRLKVSGHVDKGNGEMKFEILYGTSQNRKTFIKTRYRIEVDSIRGGSASYCVNSGCSSLQFTELTATRANSPSYSFNLDHLPSGNIDLTIKNNTTGKTTSTSFAIIEEADAKAKCPRGVWTLADTAEFPPFAGNGDKDSSFYDGQQCPCTLSTGEVKDISGKRWVCKAASATTTTAGGCTYYDYINGDPTNFLVKTLKVGDKASRSLSGDIETMSCQGGTQRVRNYKTQDIECAKEDVKLGDGLKQVKAGISMTANIDAACQSGTSVAKQSCTYYHWPFGDETKKEVKRMDAGSQVTRHLIGTYSKTNFSDCPTGKEGLAIRYKVQTVSCLGDVSAEGDGLRKVSVQEETKVLENCR